jgi:mRNA interferase MazF
MRAGEIYLARFPFGDTPGMKLRPVLLLTGTVGSVPEVLVAYISSVIPTQPFPSDLIIDPSSVEFQGTSLKVVSALRLHKLATIHSSSVARHLGELEPTQFGIARDKLRTLLGLVPSAPPET